MLSEKLYLHIFAASGGQQLQKNAPNICSYYDYKYCHGNIEDFPWKGFLNQPTF